MIGITVAVGINQLLLIGHVMKNKINPTVTVANPGRTEVDQRKLS